MRLFMGHNRSEKSNNNNYYYSNNTNASNNYTDNSNLYKVWGRGFQAANSSGALGRAWKGRAAVGQKAAGISRRLKDPNYKNEQDGDPHSCRLHCLRNR